MNYSETSYESVKNSAIDFIEGSSKLLYEITRLCPNFKHSIRMLISFFDYYNNEENEYVYEDTQEQRTLEKDLINMNSYLPYLWLMEEYDCSNFVLWYVVLVQNYGDVIAEHSDGVQKTLNAIKTLLTIEKNFSRLIYVSSLLTDKIAGNLDATNSVKLSRKFFDSMFKE